MIDVGYFHDAQHKCYNGVFLSRPEINFTSGPKTPSGEGTYDEMVEMLVTGWNRATPGEHITADALNITEIPPWKGEYGDDTEEDVHVVEGPLR